MLGTRMSNQDEDEVEDELDALEREVNGTSLPSLQELPDTPTVSLPEADVLGSQAEQQKARARARMRQRAAESAEPLLA